MTAETSPYRLAELPEDNRAVLAAIAADARAALAEMRVLLGTLRGDGDEPALAPQPGWAELDRLVDDARERGVEVCHHRAGAVIPTETTGLAASLSLDSFPACSQPSPRSLLCVGRGDRSRLAYRSFLHRRVEQKRPDLLGVRLRQNQHVGCLPG